jgi:hypothetical protein
MVENSILIFDEIDDGGFYGKIGGLYKWES